MDEKENIYKFIEALGHIKHYIESKKYIKTLEYINFQITKWNSEL